MRARLVRTITLLAVALTAVHAPAVGQVLRQLTDVRTTDVGAFAVDDSGDTIVAVTSGDPLGTNPEHAFRVFVWSFPGPVVSELPLPPGSVAADVLSITDDASWIWFLSKEDLVPGSNADLGRELFRIRPDGTDLAQVTSFASGAGELIDAVVSGDGSRLVVHATVDPLGSNAALDEQLFVMSSSGPFIAQLTSFPGDRIDGIAISDDGTRIAFSSEADPFGQNLDGRFELFTVFANGAGLLQRTFDQFGDALYPAISGDGQWLACADRGRLTARPFGGAGGLTDYGEADFRWGPSMPDDGSVLYQVRDAFPLEIAATPTAGGPSTVVAFTAGGILVSGDGTRIVHGLGETRSSGHEPRIAQYGLARASASGSNPLTLLSGAPPRLRLYDAEPDLDGIGSSLVFTSNYLDGATFDDRAILRIESDGTGRRRIVDPGPTHPSLSDDGTTLVWLGTDVDCSRPEVVRTDGEGNGAVSLTADPTCLTFPDYPVLSADGTTVVYVELGTSLERVASTGGAATLIDDDGAGKGVQPRSSADGAWITYHSETDDDGLNPSGLEQIFRTRTDGTLRQRLTSDQDHLSLFPDISADGQRVVWVSDGDPLGTNPDHRWELFLYDAGDDSTTQLTSYPVGDRPLARISGDGETVWFHSTRALLGAPGGDELYRLTLSTGTVERVGGLSDRLVGTYEGVRGRPFAGGFAEPRMFDNRNLTLDHDGDRAAFVASIDATGDNPDRSFQLFMVDLTQPPSIRVGVDTPTLVEWDVEPEPWRYDVVRGDVANLALGDLGAVSCVEDGSLDARTIGDEDALQPSPGQVLFYLYRAEQPGGPGSYGTATGGAERVAASGDCPT